MKLLELRVISPLLRSYQKSISQNIKLFSSGDYKSCESCQKQRNVTSVACENRNKKRVNTFLPSTNIIPLAFSNYRRQTHSSLYVNGLIHHLLPSHLCSLRRVFLSSRWKRGMCPHWELHLPGSAIILPINVNKIFYFPVKMLVWCRFMLLCRKPDSREDSTSRRVCAKFLANEI